MVASADIRFGTVRPLSCFLLSPAAREKCARSEASSNRFHQVRHHLDCRCRRNVNVLYTFSRSTNTSLIQCVTKIHI